MQSSIEPFKELIAVFSEDAGFEVSAHLNYQNLYINQLESETNEFMLRLSNKHFLTVARISFLHQRNGFGTKVLEWLKAYGIKNGYENIMFESVLTIEMKTFLVKNGFELLYPNSINWILPVKSGSSEGF